MKRHQHCGVALLPLVCILAFCTVASNALRTFVVEQGQDSELHAILDKATSHRCIVKEDVEVLLPHGTIKLSRPISFKPCYEMHSHQERTESPSGPRLFVRGHNLGTTFDGGSALENCAPVSASKSWLYRCDVPTGFSQQISQLWANGQRRVVGRSPTMAYNRTSVAEGSQTPAHALYPNPNQLLASYSNASNMRVVVYHSWTASFHAVTSVSNSPEPVVNVSNPIFMYFNYGGLDGPGGNRYYLENAIEYVTPGSGMFYHDQGSNHVFYAPLPEELNTRSHGNGRNQQLPELVAPRLVELVNSVGVHDVSFSDVTFQHAAVDFEPCLQGTCDAQSADFLQTAALNWVNSTGIVLHNVTVAHTGGYAVWMNVGSSNSLISHSTLTDLGAGGVRIGKGLSGSPPLTMLANNITVSDCYIFDGGHVFREGCGVLLEAATASTVQHNLIHDLHYTGVSVGWTWNYVKTDNHNNTVAFNEIHTIGMGDLSDMGCVSIPDWICCFETAMLCACCRCSVMFARQSAHIRSTFTPKVYHLGMDNGTRVVNNVCHNVTSYNYGGWGYYTDQSSRFVHFENNIAYNTKCAGFHQHYGLNITMVNNVFAYNNLEDCDAAIRSSAHDAPGDEGDTSSFTFERNIVLVHNGTIFYATSNNSFFLSSFDNNVYWSESGGAQGVTFPCDPSNPFSGQDYLGTGEALGNNMTLFSKSHTAAARMQDDGNFCIVHVTSGEYVWCTNTSQSQPGGEYTATMQGDGNFCVTQAQPPPSKVKVLFCDMVSAGSMGDYFAIINDNCTFCVHKGVSPDTGDEGPLWCTDGVCSNVENTLGAFPTDCSLSTWQKQGNDLHGTVADPKFLHADKFDFSDLAPDSPALARGFQPIDTSSVGPRSAQ